MPDNTAPDKVSARLTQDVIERVDARATADGHKNRADWFRSLIMDALDPEGPSAVSTDEKIAELKALLKDTHHRVRMVETRMYYENHALFHLMTYILSEGVYARIASIAGACSTDVLDEGTLMKESEATFKRLDDMIVAELKKMRDEAVTRARSLPDISDDVIAGTGD